MGTPPRLPTGKTKTRSPSAKIVALRAVDLERVCRAAIPGAVIVVTQWRLSADSVAELEGSIGILLRTVRRRGRERGRQTRRPCYLRWLGRLKPRRCEPFAHVGCGIKLPDFPVERVHLRAGFEPGKLRFHSGSFSGDVFFKCMGDGSSATLHDTTSCFTGPNRTVCSPNSNMQMTGLQFQSEHIAKPHLSVLAPLCPPRTRKGPPDFRESDH